MTDFETKLIELITQYKQTSSKIEKKEISGTQISLLKDELIKTEDYSSFLKIVEQNFTKYHIPAEAIVDALHSIPEATEISLLGSIQANYEKALVYQLITQLLVQGKVSEGIGLLTHCCDQSTGGCRKKPPKDIIQKIGSAMFQVPIIKEKPLKILLENDLSMSVLLCLLHVVFDQTPKGKKNKVYTFIENKLVLQSFKIWADLESKDRKAFEDLIRPLLKNKTISDFYLDDGLEDSIFDKFLKSIKPTEKGEIKDSKDIYLSESLTSISVYDIKPPKTAKIDRQPPIITVQQPKQIPDIFNPIQALNNLNSWIIKTKGLIKDSEEKDKLLKNKIASLEQDIEKIKNEKSDLQGKISNLSSTIERNSSEIEALNEKLESKEREYQEKLRRVVKESENRENRAIDQMKNRIASDIQSPINQFISMSQANDLSSREKGLIRTFRTVIDVLSHLHKIGISL